MAEKPFMRLIRELIRCAQPGGACPASRLPPIPGSGAFGTSQRWTFHIKGWPERLEVSSSWEQARRRLPELGISHSGMAQRSSWIIPGLGRTGHVMLGTAVAQLWEERSPMGAASSCKSTRSPGKSLGTKCRPEYSFPQRLLQLQHQMGLLKRC